MFAGWEQIQYSTSESSGSVELCASVTSPDELQLDPFTLNVEYMNITAGILAALLLMSIMIIVATSADAGGDYSITSSSVTIGPFSQASRRACVTVDITDDTVAENLETFSAMLVLSFNPANQLQLTITPSKTLVNILDNEGEKLNDCRVYLHNMQD